jgi:hypothetical protein
MDIKTYDSLCIISSFLALILLTVMRNKFTYCGIYILTAIFSLIWRIYRLNTRSGQNHPLFYLDLLFALLTIYFCCFSRDISIIAVGIFVVLMILSWTLKLMNNIPVSNIVHCSAHYLIIGYLLVCFLTL